MPQSHKACPVTLANILIPDVYLALERADPAFVYARIMDGDSTDTPIVDVTRKTLLRDAHHAAAYLVAAGCTPRAFGEDETRTVAFLAASTYAYFVYMLACFLIGWTVRTVHSQCKSC